MKITLTKPTRASYLRSHQLPLTEAKDIALGLISALKRRFEEESDNPLRVEVDYNMRHSESLGTLTAFYLVETQRRFGIGRIMFGNKDPKIIFSVALTGYGDICVNGLDCNMYQPETSVIVLEEVAKYAKENSIVAHAGNFAIV